MRNSDGRKIRIRRSIENLSIRIETGTVTRTVPGLFRVIPPDHPGHMRTDGGAGVKLSLRIAIRRDFMDALVNDDSLVTVEIFDVRLGVDFYPIGILNQGVHVFRDQIFSR